jgi:hypothetical protein
VKDDGFYLVVERSKARAFELAAKKFEKKNKRVPLLKLSYRLHTCI